MCEQVEKMSEQRQQQNRAMRSSPVRVGVVMAVGGMGRMVVERGYESAV